MEEKAERLKTQHESVSAQLQVVYEHKTRLEKAVQEEKAQHKKTKDELTSEKGALVEKMQKEKNDLDEELARLRSEHSKLDYNYQKIEGEKQGLRDELTDSQDKCKHRVETIEQEKKQERQECDNEVAQLKDEIADLGRRNAEMETKLQNVSISKGEVVKPPGGNRNKSLNEEQNLMQIAEPNDNKHKAYFEVKDPVPDDNQIANARQLPPAHEKQVVPPIIKNPDADAGVSRNVDAGAGANQGVGADIFVGAEPDAAANAGKIPNALEGQLRDNLVNRSYARSFDDDANHLVQRGAPEGVREERNPVPVQVPAPAQKDPEGAVNRLGGLDRLGRNDPQDENLKPVQDFRRGRAGMRGQDFKRHHAEVPGQILNPVQGDNPDANAADEEAEDEQAQNEDQVGEQVRDSELKRKVENEQDDYNDINRNEHARDM